MKRLKFLLLDANVVIYLFKLGLWNKLVELCDILLARTVMREAHFYEDDKGARHDFDLSRYESNGAIAVFDVPLPDLQVFRSSFDPTYLDKLDAGEAESLAYLVKGSDLMLICSADAIVFRVVGNLDRSHQGRSLEEILVQLGLGRPLPRQFTKTFREHWSRRGTEEAIYGTGSTHRR
jgi:hypothetical protein